MKTAIILHGTLGSPQGNWFQWLKDQLEVKGLQVWLPQLPHAEQPSLHEWASFVQRECPFVIDQETLIVGHSSGAILALVLAQQNPEPVGQIVCISVFHDNSLQWEPNNKLFDVAFDWEVIRANAKKLLFVHSDNDPYVPLEQAQFVANNCQAELITIPGQGHFNLEQSKEYAQFPRLFEILEDGMNIKHSPSAGGIVRNSQNEVLLVNEGDGFWGFPKGRPEKGEALLETAVREIAEETGLTEITKIVELGSYQRHPVMHGVENKAEIKDITLFLFRTNQTLSDKNPENNECKWFPVEQVASKLSHIKDRLFFEQAMDRIRVRLHGQPPYSLIAVHGGPGGVGEARPFAEKLAQEYGVVEPFLLSESLEGQLDDLKAAIEQHTDAPTILIGHSYGAMLSYIFAARYPTLVKKLILVSSGVLEAEDTEQINNTRLSRLSNEQKGRLESARNKYADSNGEAKDQAFTELFTLVQQADAYDLLPHESDLEVVRPQLYESVWKDMVALRDSGDLVRFGSKIACPVIAIHGNYDPRSGQAIKESLSSHVKDFQFILLEKCGHYPWYEKQAKDQFYAELRALVSSSDEHGE